MEVKIITPEGEKFSGEADAVTVPGTKGRFQILNNHAPIISTLQSGVLQIHTATSLSRIEEPEEGLEIDREKKNITLKVKCGTIQFRDNKLVILAE